MLAANLVSDRPSSDFLTAVAVRPDGKIVAVGGASKRTTGFDSRAIYDVVALRAR